MEKVRTITLNLYSEDFQTDQVRGTITVQPGCKDEYNIVLNSSISEDEQTAAAVHEFLHAYHDDFNRKDKTAKQIEAERHAEIRRIMEVLF